MGIFPNILVRPGKKIAANSVSGGVRVIGGRAFKRGGPYGTFSRIISNIPIIAAPKNAVRAAAHSRPSPVYRNAF